MSNYQNHVSSSVVVGIAYAALGVVFLNVYWEYAALAMLLVIIAQSIPDIDANSSIPSRELSALLAVISPVVLIELFPGIKAGGMTRIALVMILCYLATRVVVTRGLQHLTVYRGMMHSIPAAVIATQVTYLLFIDLFWIERFYVSGAVFCGFIAHLLLDASGNIDLVGKAVGNESKKDPVLKFVGKGLGINVAAYTCILLLGWFIAKDYYPRLDIHAGLTF